MGEKWPKNGRKMGKELPFFTHFLGQFSHFSAIFHPFSHSRPFFTHFPGGAKSIFRPFLQPFRAGGPKWEMGFYQTIRIAKLEVAWAGPKFHLPRNSYGIILKTRTSSNVVVRAPFLPPCPSDGRVLEDDKVNGFV